MGVVADDFVKTVTRCLHCGEECPRGVNYCKGCKTKPQRDEVDAENKKIREQARKKNEQHSKETQ